MGIWDTISDALGFGATLGDITDIGGTAGDDYLLGTDSGERIDGYAGNDWIKGNGGADTVFGQEGDDLIEGGSGNDYIDGGAGVDTASYFNTNHGVVANLEFGTASTFGAGPVDSDTLVNIENLTGSFYDDSLQGSELANRIEAGAGKDVVIGWGGNDALFGHFGADFLVGGDGNDAISGGFDNDTLQGNAGTDTVDYSYSYVGMVISLAQGNAHVRIPSSTVDTDSLNGFENVIGSQFDDDIEGNSAINTLNGGTGNDTVSYRNSGNGVGVNLSVGWGQYGDAFQDTYISIENITGSEHAGGDSLTGNASANRIEGRGGNDVINGLDGDDALSGGDGADFIDGGAGNDLVGGAEGANILNGGAGFDTLNLNPSSGGVGAFGPGVSVDLALGTVNGLGQDGTTVANFEMVRGTSFEDQMLGDANTNIFDGSGNADTLSGRGGVDLLDGSEGLDTLNGGTGNDFLIGGLGRDVQTGGGGSDTFIFRDILDSGITAASRDAIRDFEVGRDKLGLAAIDANALLSGDQQFIAIGAADFSGQAGELRFASNGTTTALSADVNGDMVSDFQILLNGDLVLTAADFIL